MASSKEQPSEKTVNTESTEPVKGKKNILTIIIAAVALVLSFFGISVSGLLGDLGIDLSAMGGGSLVSSSGDELDVHFIDVRQADCTLVQCNGETLLIDAGETDCFDRIKTYLGNLGVTRLDYVIATHPHADHIGSMAKIIQNYDIGTFIMPDVPDALTPTTASYDKMIAALEKKDCEVQAAVPLDTFTVGGATVTILGPNGTYDNLNNWSVVCRLVYGETSFMFTGDAEAMAEKDILKLDTEFQSTVLKMGHHGSSTSTSQAFWDAVDPRYCVIMCGKNNDYGHPHKETLQLLDDYQIIPYRTDLDGNIVFRVVNGEITVTTEK